MNLHLIVGMFVKPMLSYSLKCLCCNGALIVNKLVLSLITTSSQSTIVDERNQFKISFNRIQVIRISTVDMVAVKIMLKILTAL